MSGIQEELSASQIEESVRIANRREHPGKLRFFATLNLGIFFTSLGVELFKSPNHFALGGTSGMSIILATLFPGLPVSAFMWVINAILVVLGLVSLDRKTMGWTVYTSFALSAYISLLELLLPMPHPLTDDTLLELIFAVLLPAVGSAIVFNIGASTGGTDILAMILKKHTSLEIGKALMVVDSLIVAAAAVIYGPRTGLYCVLGLLAKAFFVDVFIESINTLKVCTVISRNPDEVLRFIVTVLHRTATVRKEWGGFSGREERVLVTVLSRREATKLRNQLRRSDPSAFITIVNSSEIIGRGFRGV
ncbi:YitT family protein [uncultured Olsenella sp.]|uniref:YitT family protein n=1 Tax=uncultured Olsenella sp. TaxID=190764 RepID=UPI0026DC4134|nr:YitT family protein [uncultured Olsenella sp.]